VRAAERQAGRLGRQWRAEEERAGWWSGKEELYFFLPRVIIIKWVQHTVHNFPGYHSWRGGEEGSVSNVK
jgi:hypothetical protein